MLRPNGEEWFNPKRLLLVVRLNVSPVYTLYSFLAITSYRPVYTVVHYLNLIFFCFSLCLLPKTCEVTEVSSSLTLYRICFIYLLHFVHVFFNFSHQFISLHIIFKAETHVNVYEKLLRPDTTTGTADIWASGCWFMNQMSLFMMNTYCIFTISKTIYKWYHNVNTPHMHKLKHQCH